MELNDFVNANVLKSVYYALFESHISYSCIIWGQNKIISNCLYILQKKALRITDFKNGIIKIADKVSTENCLFINKYTNNKLLSIFTNWFTFSSVSHNYQRSFASMGNLQLPSSETKSYGKQWFCLYCYKNLE